MRRNFNDEKVSKMLYYNEDNMKPLDKCCLVLEGEDARRFEEYLKEPPTEQDIEIAKRVRESMKLFEREELIKLIEKMNCGNCIYACSSSKKDTCNEWEEK